MSRTIKDKTIALAGVFQAAQLVQQVARHGRDISPAVEASVHSLFKVDARDSADVFGGLHGIGTGLRLVETQLGADGRRHRDLEITRYLVALMFLERKLSRRRKMQEEIRTEVAAAAGQADYFSETHPNVIARLADVYRNTISNLKPRIMVSGEAAVLSNPDNAALIRALLLAGIRAAVLWRQCGGSRLQLLLRRAALVQTASALLDELARTSPDAGVGENAD
jgi:high frequency lysogenization protein